MKNIITFLIIIISISCSAKKNVSTDYSEYAIRELKNKKIALNLELNYQLVNHYLEQIERNEISHMALTKIDIGIIKPYWENESELNIYYDTWKLASSKIVEFEKEHAPELKELSNQFKKNKIKKEKYFKKNREIRARLGNTYPAEYSRISKDHTTSLKTMWKQTGRFMLEDYKLQGKTFPIYWIPEKDRENSKKTKKYKSINQELLLVNAELNRKL